MSYPLIMTIKQLGAANALLYWCGRGLATISRERCGLFRYHFVTQAVASSDDYPATRHSRLRFLLFNASHPLLEQGPRPVATILQRFNQGATCMAATLSGQLVAFLWLVPDSYMEDEIRARYALPDKQSQWDFDVWVAPEYRASPVFARLWQQAHRYLAQQGTQRTYSRISAFNPQSLRAHQSLQSQRVGSALFLKLGRFQIMLSAMPPYFHCSGHPSRAPVFRFDPPRRLLMQGEHR